MPTCIRCNVPLNDSNWLGCSRRSHFNICIPCRRKEHNAYTKKYRKTPKGRLIWLATMKRRNEKLRLEVLRFYSPNLTCQRCGCNDIRALSIDHIRGGGLKHRKELKLINQKFYRWLKKNNYPFEYQVLCMNCQWVKRHENNENGNIIHEVDDVKKCILYRRKYSCERARKRRESNKKCKTNHEVSNKSITKYFERLEKDKIRRTNLKLEVYRHYSPALICQWPNCGISDLRVLSLDHINNDGYKHGKTCGGQGAGVWYWIKRNGFPEGFQILCMNHQWIKRREKPKITL